MYDTPHPGHGEVARRWAPPAGGRDRPVTATVAAGAAGAGLAVLLIGASPTLAFPAVLGVAVAGLFSGSR